MADPRLTDAEAYERAREHDAKAQQLEGQAAMLQARAGLHRRWAAKWRDCADDDYGSVPYPGESR